MVTTAEIAASLRTLVWWVKLGVILYVIATAIGLVAGVGSLLVVNWPMDTEQGPIPYP